VPVAIVTGHESSSFAAHYTVRTHSSLLRVLRFSNPWVAITARCKGIDEPACNKSVSHFIHMRQPHGIAGQGSQMIHKPRFIGILLQQAANASRIVGVLISGHQMNVDSNRIPFVKKDLIDHLQQERIDVAHVAVPS
jgi:hypothetical protein